MNCTVSCDIILVPALHNVAFICWLTATEQNFAAFTVRTIRCHSETVRHFSFRKSFFISVHFFCRQRCHI